MSGHCKQSQCQKIEHLISLTTYLCLPLLNALQTVEEGRGELVVNHEMLSLLLYCII